MIKILTKQLFIQLFGICLFLCFSITFINSYKIPTNQIFQIYSLKNRNCKKQLSLSYFSSQKYQTKIHVKLSHIFIFIQEEKL